jgi:hypothetical protein
MPLSISAKIGERLLARRHALLTVSPIGASYGAIDNLNALGLPGRGYSEIGGTWLLTDPVAGRSLQVSTRSSSPATTEA